MYTRFHLFLYYKLLHYLLLTAECGNKFNIQLNYDITRYYIICVLSNEQDDNIQFP